jgi:HSP20 family protein
MVDVDSDDEGLIVRLEVPGIPPEALKVETHERTLVIRAEHEDRAFTRSLRLPTDADVERIGAKLEHGVLTLRIPKSEAAKPREIKVKVH